MKAVSSTWQTQLQTRIGEVLARFSDGASRYQLDKSSLNYISDLSVKGKQFRGSILLDFYQLLGAGEHAQGTVDVAVAVELYGTALLIHDDIMDRSELRRSLPTAHTFFSAQASHGQLSEPDHFGVGAAICLGDVLFFLADRVVAEARLPAELRLKVMTVCSTELALLGLAQVEDLRLSSSARLNSEQDVLRMYAGKTGRYTGRWPLHLACILAGMDEKMTAAVAAVGEKIGVLYQLKDDELGLFGAESMTGKSVTSDITEGKKTLYYFYLDQLTESEEKLRVFSIIGNANATSLEIESVKKVIEDHGIKEKVAEEIDDMKKEIDEAVKALTLPETARAYLHTVTEFVVTRTS